MGVRWLVLWAKNMLLLGSLGRKRLSYLNLLIGHSIAHASIQLIQCLPGQFWVGQMLSGGNGSLHGRGPDLYSIESRDMLEASTCLGVILEGLRNPP